MPTTYFKGNKAVYTGKAEVLYGKLFYEIKMLEGVECGALRWTPKPPTV